MVLSIVQKSKEEARIQKPTMGPLDSMLHTQFILVAPLWGI